MHPSSLLSYYPTYAILDEILSYGNYKTLNIYMDLKNVMQSVYMEHAIVNIVEASKQSKYLDTSVFSSLISFLSFHKIYGIKRGINTNFTIFFETGQSYYHKNIDNENESVILIITALNRFDFIICKIVFRVHKFNILYHLLHQPLLYIFQHSIYLTRNLF